MKALMYGLIMACVGLSVGSYQQLTALNERVADIKIPVITEQQVVTLPEDGKAYYTSLFLKADWQKDAKSRALKSWFDTNITLASLRSQTHFNIVTPADPQWKSKYSKTVAELPCFALTDAEGNVVYKISGNNIPNDSKILASEVGRRCPNRRCPINETQPDEKETVPDSGPILDSKPPELTPVSEEFPLWLGLLLGMAGVAAAVVPDVVNKYKAMG